MIALAADASGRAAGSRRYKDKSPETEARPDRAGRLRRAQALPRQTWEGLPQHVQSCAANRHRRGSLHLWVWDPKNPLTKTRIPYFCRSWRCPYCSQHESHVLFARIQEAFATTDPKDVVFLVLTLNPQEHLRGKSRLADVYREFSSRGERFLKRVRRWMLRHGMTPFGGEWVSTVEAHRSGIPHINYMIRSADLAAFLRRDCESRRPGCESDVNATLIRGELQTHLLDCGFGWRSTAEALRLDEKPQEGISVLAGYITKMACTADQTHGELAKLTQVPTMAPKNFRRLRSGKGFLPLRRKGERTGALIRRYRAREGDEVAEAVSRSTNPEYMTHVRACERKEQELIYAEERMESQKPAFVRLGLPLPKPKWVRAFQVDSRTADRASSLQLAARHGS